MFEVELFLGFPLNSAFTDALKSLDPRLVELFIHSGKSDYLEKVSYRQSEFIGKYVGEMSDIQSLALLEANIYSILKKLIPNYPYDSVPLVLFPAEKRVG